MQHQVVLQADGQPKGERENFRQLFTHHHAIAVIVLGGTAETLIDLESIDAGFGRPGEDCPVDHVLAVPIVLIGHDLAGQEFPNGVPVGLMVRAIQRPSHWLGPLAADGVYCQRFSHSFNLA